MQQFSSTLNRYVVPDMPSADELMPYLRQIDKNRWYSNFGPLVSRFEERLTQHLAASPPISGNEPLALTTVMTCYHALQIGLQIFRLPPQARVLIPAVTFPACPLAVRHAGAEPVLADINAESWQLTPETAKRVAAKTSIHAVMPVAVYGVPVPAEDWDRFSEETGIPIIIDAAAALDAQPIPRKGLVAHSLHATKPFSIGEGGILISRDRSQINEARCISNFGTQQRVALQDGSNAKMSEYHAAVALAQLDRWKEVKERRKKAYTQFQKILETSGLDIGFQKDIETAIPSVLMLKIKAPRATSIVNALNARGVAAHRMYLPPLYHHPNFAELTIADGNGKTLTDGTLEKKSKFMKNSEDLQRHVFGVPLHAFMSEDDMKQIVQALTEAMG